MEEIVNRYIKENNIGSYLCCNDIDKIIKIMTLEELDKINKLSIEEDEELEDYIYSYICDYNYRLSIKNEDIEEMINYIFGCEFDIEINEAGKIDLIDTQGVYLGADYNSYENFETIAEALGRLSGSYLYDYFGIEVY